MHPLFYLGTSGQVHLKSAGDEQGSHLLEAEVDEGKLQRVRQNDDGVLTEELNGEHPREDFGAYMRGGNRGGGETYVVYLP